MLPWLWSKVVGSRKNVPVCWYTVVKRKYVVCLCMWIDLSYVCVFLSEKLVCIGMNIWMAWFKYMSVACIHAIGHSLMFIWMCVIFFTCLWSNGSSKKKVFRCVIKSACLLLIFPLVVGMCLQQRKFGYTSKRHLYHDARRKTRMYWWSSTPLKPEPAFEKW